VSSPGISRLLRRHQPNTRTRARIAGHRLGRRRAPAPRPPLLRPPRLCWVVLLTAAAREGLLLHESLCHSLLLIFSPFSGSCLLAPGGDDWAWARLQGVRVPALGCGDGLAIAHTAAPNHCLGARIRLKANRQTAEQKVFQISIFLLNSKWSVECVIVLLNFLCNLIVFLHIEIGRRYYQFFYSY
jgi:hypothetical protein